MNPIYRHSFVNAFLANGAISHITGNINGNSTKFYYTRTFTTQSGGAFYDSNKKIIGGWGSDPSATNTEFDIPSNAA